MWTSKNKALTEMFGRNREGTTGGWRKLQNEELQNLCSLPKKLR